MRIGIDFDNTLVSYDRLFYRLAREAGLIPGDLPAGKRIIRDYLRARDQNDRWTELQGMAYGARLAEAEPFPGVEASLTALRKYGHRLFVISHRTRFPFAGPRVDLQRAAREWLLERGWLAPSGHLFEDACFLGTREEKIDRISQCDCDAFVDDLVEVLREPCFPKQTRRILFDPGGMQSLLPGEYRLDEWSSAALEDCL